jgi:crotonobetainyl-CoA:carnitine CoA-transferase CaiB-like acyl-CoA transferase
MSSQRTQRSPLFTWYRASDDWFAISIIDPRHWPALCRVARLPELESDPRFAGTKGRNQHAGELIAILDEQFGRHTRDEWLRLLQAEEIPCGPVNTYAEMAADEQVLANGYITDFEDPRLGLVRVPGLAIGLSRSPGELGSAPELGQHTEEVLREAGYSWEEIQRLRECQAIL